MADDCRDADDAPDGSFEDLQEDFASAIEDFRARAREDREKRADGVAVGARTEAEPGLDGRTPQPTISYQPTFETKQPPFNPDPALLVPHYEDGAGRPLPRRPDATPPLRSAGLSVKRADGSDAEQIEPGESYRVEATVRNMGGTPARNATVELFVGSETAGGTFDRQSGVGNGPVRLLPGRPEDGQVTLTGYTTYTSDRIFLAFAYEEAATESVTGENFLEKFQNESLEGNLLTVNGATVAEGERTFSIDGNWYREGNPPDGGEFEIYLFQLPESQYDDEYIGFALLPSLVQYHQDSQGTETWSDPFVAEVDATLRSDAAPKQGEPLPLATSLDGELSSRVGRTQVSIPQNDTTTVSFDYRPSSATNESELVLSTFHVRAYSLATNEVPADWGRVDHTESRFMARTEVKRTL